MDVADYVLEGLPEIRKRLAADLRWDEVPDDVWGYVEKLELPYKAWVGGSDEWEELVSEARQYKKHSATGAPVAWNLPEERRKSPPNEVSVELDEDSERRALVFSAVAAMLAGRRASVREFRAKHLGGEDTRLTEEQAAKLLYELEPQFVRVNGTIERRAEFVLTEQIRGNLIQLRADLDRTARRLSKDYRWRYDAAQWFVLTGNAPYVRPLTVKVDLTQATTDDASFRNREYQLHPAFKSETAEITLVAEPWVDAELVAQAYRSVQRQILGGDNRKKDRRTLDAVLFAARQIRERGSFSWSELVRAWNDTQRDPGRRYKDRRGLHQAFARFLRPRYNEPRFRRYQPEPWQRHRDAQRDKAHAEMERMSPELKEVINSLAVEPDDPYQP